MCLSSVPPPNLGCVVVQNYVLSSPIRSSDCLGFVGDQHLNVIRSEQQL